MIDTSALKKLTQNKNKELPISCKFHFCTVLEQIQIGIVYRFRLTFRKIVDFALYQFRTLLTRFINQQTHIK